MAKPLELQISSYKDEMGNLHNLSVADYRLMVSNRDTFGIADFFLNAYLSVFRLPPFIDEIGSYVHMFKLCKLMAGIELYRNGWIHREKTMAAVYESFIDNSAGFAPLHGHAREFYKNIARPVLYTGAIEKGWNISANGYLLFDPETRTVDIKLMAAAMIPISEDYFASLKAAAWDDLIWQNFRRRLHADLGYWGFHGFDD